MQLFIISGHCFIGYKSKFCELENCLLFKSFIMQSILYSCLSITTIYLSINVEQPRWDVKEQIAPKH